MATDCYYHKGKRCLARCAALCDDGSDFIAGGSPCVRELKWLLMALAFLVAWLMVR
jgi:hypothetical protein